jgi:hypothetical protein
MPRPAGTLPDATADGTTLTIAPPATVTSNFGTVPPLWIVEHVTVGCVVPFV